MARKKTHVQARTGTLKVRDDLYDLGKIKVFVSREFFQGSSEIERF